LLVGAATMPFALHSCSLREIMLFGLAVFSVAHILIELVVYPLFTPQDEIMSKTGSTAYSTPATTSLAARNMGSQRDHIRGGV